MVDEWVALGGLVERRGSLGGDSSIEGGLDCLEHCLKNKNKKTGWLVKW